MTQREWYLIYERVEFDNVSTLSSRFTLEDAIRRMIRHDPRGALYRLRNVVTGEIIPRDLFGE